MNALIIEDNPTDVALLKGILQNARDIEFVVWNAASLADGLALLQEQSLDIVLLDLGLPDSQGVDGVHEILKRVPTMPVVVITAEDNEVMALDALREGAQDYMVKGMVSVELVIRSIRYAVERSRFERRIQEVSRRRSELERIVNQSPAVAFVWRNDDIWTVDYVSDNVAQFGYTSVDFSNQQMGFLDIVHVEDKNRIKHELARFLKEQQESFTMEYRIITKDGSERWVNDWSWVRRNQRQQVISIEGVILDVTERRKLEISIMEVSSREQQRIGQDLHDDLGQYLTGLAFKCKALQQQLVAEGLSVAEEVASLGGLINEAITRAHGLAQGLNPVGLDSEGLLIALEGMAANIAHMYNTNCVCTCENPILFKHCKASTQLYWIAHEAVHNAVKYSKAEHIQIQLGGDKQYRWLKIVDDGVGIKREPKASGRMGLHIMRSRAKMLGGVLDISSSEGSGTAVMCIYHDDKV